MAVTNISTVTGVGGGSSGGGGGSGPTTTVLILESDVTDNNTGNKVPLTGIAQALEANSHYTCDFTLYTFSDGLCTLGFWPTYPTNREFAFTGSGEWAPVGAYQPTIEDDATAKTASFTSANAAHYMLYRLTVDVKTGADAGTLTLRFVSSGGTYGTILAGSHSILRKLA